MEEGYPVTVSFEKLRIQKFLVNNPITFNLFDNTTAAFQPFEFSWLPSQQNSWAPSQVINDNTPCELSLLLSCLVRSREGGIA